MFCAVLQYQNKELETRTYGPLSDERAYMTSNVDIKRLKVKVTLVQALRLCTGRTAHRGSRGITLLFLDRGTRRGEGSASRPDRSLLPGKTRY